MLERINPTQAAKALICLIILFLAYIIFNQTPDTGKTHVALTLIPDDAQIQVDGKNTNDTSLELKPGNYTFTATKNGWGKFTIFVKVGSEPLKIGLIPSPVSEESFDYLQSNPLIQLEREKWGGLNSALIDDQITQETPFVKLLPYEDIYGPFKVDYSSSDDRELGIAINISNSTPPGRKNFLGWLGQQGQDPTNFEIIYEDFNNPFLGDN